MESAISPLKKVKSTVFDNFNTKTSITCSKVPDGLFDTTTAKKHFSKFGRVQKIKFFPKRQMCIVEYEQLSGVEQAILNAGAFDGFLFDVVRTKARIRKSKKEDDPDWLPDPDVEEELSAMRGGPTYRIPRQKAMDIDPVVTNVKVQVPRIAKPIRKALPTSRLKHSVNAPATGESPALIALASTSMSTSEAAVELHQLRSRVSFTPDEQWRTLDARDRILRAWGGAGSRVKVGGATIGTCPDMCPEKELLHRQAEHQVMTLETVPDSDGQMEAWRAVKQYSRSSADQEIPMCYELRPAHVLTKTCSYLLSEIADTKRQVTLADWFHFMWDRFRGIRKDITQQALCCADSIRLVEACARFHAHCAARLADLEHTQFDQKLNTDNLTKCLQTLKHMYADVGPELKPREAEFRGYIALLNLGDTNFLWEIKQLPQEIQKSDSIMFVIKIFAALDNNNYVRFFRLVKEKATYLQACILLRYFNDVRARALARIVKAYAPKGGSRYPAEDIMNALAFESIESMKAFINHYGLRFSKTDLELAVILDRNQFIEDSDPYPPSRAIKLIESKRQCTVGEVIAGGPVPKYDYHNQTLHSSFNKDGKLKETALLAEDLGYNTINDSNKDIKLLRMEIQKQSNSNKVFDNAESVKNVKKNVFVDMFDTSNNDKAINRSFSFQPAVPVASLDIIKTSPVNEIKSTFRFSKPQQESIDNVHKVNQGSNPFSSYANGVDPGSVFKDSKNNIFKSSITGKSLFSSSDVKKKEIFTSHDVSKNVFMSNKSSIFSEKVNDKNEVNRVFNGANNFSKIFSTAPAPVNAPTSSDFGNLFAKVPSVSQNEDLNSKNIFKTFTKPLPPTNSIFAKFEKPEIANAATNFSANTNLKVSPGSLFKSACHTEKTFSFFPSKNEKTTDEDKMLNSGKTSKDIYEFQEENNSVKLLHEEKVKEAESKLQEEMKKMKEMKMQQEEARKREEAQKRIEKQNQLEKIRKKEEERKNEEIRKKLEEERLLELKLKKAAEDEKIFKEKVEKGSQKLFEELLEDVSNEIVQSITKEELDDLKKLLLYSQTLTEEFLNEVANEVAISEMKAEIFRTQKLMKKWFYVWRKHYARNEKRRRLLEDTPVWLTENTPTEEARILKRVVEESALNNMNAIHKGYIFTGELKEILPSEPYNVMEIIKSPLLKRMQQINYPYDKCFFWKVVLVSPSHQCWFNKRVNIANWLTQILGDKNKPNENNGLVQVGKYSWNNLMDFAISVGLINGKITPSQNEVIEGANGLLFYIDSTDMNSISTIDAIMKCKYKYQTIPVAIVFAHQDASSTRSIEEFLKVLMISNAISGYKIFKVQNDNFIESLHMCTKSALKWLAKKYPKNPPIEIDYLKSICERYLGNEIWHKLRSETNSRITTMKKDLNKLIYCYNVAVDKLTDIITDEDLFNFPSFPLEFYQYLDHSSPYPKPYEFIPSVTKQSDNVNAIKTFMKQLKLVATTSQFQPSNAINMQQQIKSYCNQIGWFENPHQVACKVVATLPNDFFNSVMPSEKFEEFYEQYNLIDFLNIVIYEKIKCLHNFDNRYAIYAKASLEEYQNAHWLYDIDVVSELKYIAIDFEDNVDRLISAKRRKLENDKVECLMLEDKDFNTVNDSITSADKKIALINDYSDTLRQLEKQLEAEKMKSLEFEKLLQATLTNV
ncbi:uncharacterized protein [Battus philenor]|uniref:uncharacterized protein isoform X2 n=1 Tax=Battus philenor TaxID=42288 RepID=UPI0035CFB9E2